MNDKKTTISDLAQIVTDFRNVRGWKKFHLPRNLATSIVLESSELLELFQWDLKTFSATKIKKDKEKMEEIWKEMADIVIYILHMANALGIDISDSVNKKLVLSGKKYPIKHFNESKQDLEYYKKVKTKYRTAKKTK